MSAGISLLVLALLLAIAGAVEWAFHGAFSTALDTLFREGWSLSTLILVMPTLVAVAGVVGAVWGISKSPIERRAAIFGAVAGTVLVVISSLGMDSLVWFVELATEFVFPGLAYSVYFLGMAGAGLFIPLLIAQGVVLLILVKRYVAVSGSHKAPTWLRWLDIFPGWIQILLAWTAGLDCWAAFAAWSAQGYGDQRQVYAWPLVGPIWILCFMLVAYRTYARASGQLLIPIAVSCAAILTTLHIILFITIAIAWGVAAHFAAGGGI
jgi:hypothetical protein